MDMHIFVHNESDPRLDRILKLLEQIMATLDDTLALVTKESTDLDSVKALLAGLKQQLADALAGVTLPPAMQAKVDAIFAVDQTNAQKIADALATGVTAPPPA